MRRLQARLRSSSAHLAHFAADRNLAEGIPEARLSHLGRGRGIGELPPPDLVGLDKTAG